MKVIGYTVGTTLPKPNLAQTDPNKGDYIKNRDALDDRYYTEEEIDSKLSELESKYYTEAEIDELLYAKADTDVVLANYDESIIGLSIDGQVITYIKGDGSTHTIVTQDTDTTYSIGTDTATGLTKLYATTGSAEDGTMTQRAIKTELDKKVGVAIDDSQNTLIFTI